ncbi:MAG TPA: M56 family metallopeptidase, partial [Gemmatimonadales bacterium]|nr:M56 family metallopeptidase [Gemmatimonadales bacterium]
MSTPLSTTLFAWLLTYSIHSTVLLGIAWAVTRRARLDPAASDLLWKVALLAGLVTGTIQSRLAIASHTAVTLHVAAMTPGSRPGSAADTALASGTAGSRPGLATDTALASGTAGSRPGLATDTALASATPGSRPGLAARWLPLVLVLLWGVIALASCLYYVARRLILVGRLADRRAVADGPLATTLAELQRTTGYRRRVELTMARTISSPVALGLSEICVPELAIELGAEQQRSMLAHELAHLARRDSLWLLSASLIERFFFFQPLNRLARRELETTAEYLSDEWAMRKTGSAVSLAKCLATVAEWIQASPLGVPVAGLAERRSLLVSRIARLLDGKLPASAASRRGWAAVATLAVAATVAAAPHVSSPASPVTVNRVAGADSTSSRVPASGPKSSPSAPVSRAQSSAPGPLSATRREGTATAEQDTTVVKALIARLKDDNASVRAAAAHSLGQLGDARAVLPLIDVLADSDGEVRSNAVDALAELDDPRA